MSEFFQSLAVSGLIVLATLVIAFCLLLFSPSKVSASLTPRDWWRPVLASLWFKFSLLSGKAFYDRYWIWRRCFDEEGFCRDLETATVRTTGSALWAPVCLAFAALCYGTLVGFGRREPPPRDRQ